MEEKCSFCDQTFTTARSCVFRVGYHSVEGTWFTCQKHPGFLENVV